MGFETHIKQRIAEKQIEAIVQDMQDLQDFRKAWRKLDRKTQNATKRAWQDLIIQVHDEEHIQLLEG